jgi:predicted transcriptional regulator
MDSFFVFNNLKRLYLIKKETLSQVDIVETALSHKKLDMLNRFYTYYLKKSVIFVRTLQTANMKKHNGMRPLDIVVLLKIIAYQHFGWKTRDLSLDLGISLSEISESLNRSMIAGLIDGTKKKVFKRNLLDFLQYGIRYVFPVSPNSLAIGMLTAHSAPVMEGKIISESHYVWADLEGNSKGESIEPLFKNVPKACREDLLLYDLLALVDVFRIGKAREIKIAVDKIHELFYLENGFTP